MTDYDDEDYNMKMYENKIKAFGLTNYITIKKRLDNYKCSEIPTLQQDELMNRLNNLLLLYHFEKF